MISSYIITSKSINVIKYLPLLNEAVDKILNIYSRKAKRIQERGKRKK